MCFDDGIESEGAKMMNDGRSHCATTIRNVLDSKTESSSEDKNTEHDAREIQERDG